MLGALCLSKTPKLNGNNYCTWANKIEFLLTQSRVDYTLTIEEAPKGSKGVTIRITNLPWSSFALYD